MIEKGRKTRFQHCSVSMLQAQHSDALSHSV